MQNKQFSKGNSFHIIHNIIAVKVVVPGSKYKKKQSFMVVVELKIRMWTRVVDFSWISSEKNVKQRLTLLSELTHPKRTSSPGV